MGSHISREDKGYCNYYLPHVTMINEIKKYLKMREDKKEAEENLSSTEGKDYWYAVGGADGAIEALCQALTISMNGNSHLFDTAFMLRMRSEIGLLLKGLPQDEKPYKHLRALFEDLVKKVYE